MGSKGPEPVEAEKAGLVTIRGAVGSPAWLWGFQAQGPGWEVVLSTHLAREQREKQFGGRGKGVVGRAILSVGADALHVSSSDMALLRGLGNTPTRIKQPRHSSGNRNINNRTKSPSPLKSEGPRLAKANSGFLH